MPGVVPAYYLACATEQLTQSDLLEQAVEGERAYFDGICGCEPGPAWAWLDSAGQATEYVRLGFAVTTPVEPAVLVTLATRFPGRAFFTVGSTAALELVGTLLAGMPRRPPVYLAALDEDTATDAGRLGDGLWTPADPDEAPALIEAYHEGCAEAGREAGEILLQASFSWRGSQEHAVEGVLIRETATRQQDHAQATALETSIVSTEADEHVERIREIERLGATAVVLANVSAEPLEALRAYGRDVLPKLRG